MPSQSGPSDVAVETAGLSKKFCRELGRALRYGMQDLAVEITGRSRKASGLRPGEFWALRDLNFELRRGEILGIIGSNGAGKSTLLKVLGGMLRPDAGSATVRGRAQALIELGAGFNPVLTGRENIFVNAALLGISRETVRRRFDEIVEFSGLGDAINAPVQFYSSGMKVRLGFSVVVHLDPDVLLVDEVLSVGDAGFVSRAQKAMLALLRSGISVMFVSHGMTNILQLSHRCLWLDRGRVVMLGSPREVVEQYMSRSLASEASTVFHGVMDRADITVPDELVVDRIEVNVGKARFEPLPQYQSLTLRIECTCLQRVATGCFTVGFYGGDGTPLAFVANYGVEDGLDLEPGRHVVSIDVPVLPLRDGRYFISLSVSDNVRRLFRAEHAAEFVVPFVMERFLRLGSLSQTQMFLAADFTSRRCGTDG